MGLFKPPICPEAGSCPDYEKKSDICNENAGMSDYSEGSMDARLASCRRDIIEKRQAGKGLDETLQLD